MTVIEREEAIFTMTEEQLPKLSTSELKYICKHDLLKIDYIGRRLNRRRMREELIKDRVLITDSDKKAYFEKSIARYERRVQMFKDKQAEMIKERGEIFAKTFAEFAELKKKEKHDTVILDYYKMMLNNMNV